MAWNQPRESRGNVKPKKNNVSAKTAVIALVLVSLAIMFILWPSGTKEEVQEAVKRNEPAKTVYTPLKEALIEKKSATVPEKAKDPAKEVVARLSCITNGDGMVIERYKTADGKTHKVVRSSKKPLFKHFTDDLLSMTISGNAPMPPLPLAGNMDKAFLDSLSDPIVVEDSDDESTIAKKEAVARLRDEVDALMKQGIGFAEILREHQRIFNNNQSLRAEAIAELKKIRSEGDPEGTQEYLDKVNAFLESNDIKPISMPKTMAERKAERKSKE